MTVIGSGEFCLYYPKFVARSLCGTKERDAVANSNLFAIVTRLSQFIE
jgi:hypothetical protein